MNSVRIVDHKNIGRTKLEHPEYDSAKEFNAISWYVSGWVDHKVRFWIDCWQAPVKIIMAHLWKYISHTQEVTQYMIYISNYNKIKSLENKYFLIQATNWCIKHKST